MEGQSFLHPNEKPPAKAPENLFARLNTKYTRRVITPLIIIFGQLVFVALVLGFLSAIHTRGHSLPYRVTELIILYPQSKTFMVTFISHLLALASSYLFSKAVLYLMQVYLEQPISVAVIGIWVSLSKRSLIFERREAVWALTCAVVFLAANSLSASWNSLLTPTTIVIRTALRGSEIDLTSPVFNDQNRFDEIWSGPNGIETWLISTLPSVTSSSGAVSADSDIGHTSVLDFAGWIYFGTTGGVLPIDYGTLHPTWLATSNTEPLPPIGSDFNISMIQQGLFADVSCESRQLDENTNPPLRRSITPVNVTAVNGWQLSYNVVSIASVCPNGETVETAMITTSPTYDTIGALSCLRGVDFNITTSYSLIIDLLGKYANNSSESMVCTVTPQTIDYLVTYDLTDGYVYLDLDGVQPEDPQVKPALPEVSFAAMYAIENTFIYGQTALGNVIGDTLLVDLYSEDVYEVDTPQLMESYLQGVVSFTGTAMKVRLAGKNGTFVDSADGPPSDLVRTITGIARTTSVGWQYHEGVKNYLMLLPILFIAFASIALVLFAEYKSGFKGIPLEHGQFDPGNTLHIMAAASAGGMPDAFSGLSEEDIKKGKEKRLQLDYVDQRIGFCDVHAG